MCLCGGRVPQSSDPDLQSEHVLTSSSTICSDRKGNPASIVVENNEGIFAIFYCYSTPQRVRS